MSATYWHFQCLNPVCASEESVVVDVRTNRLQPKLDCPLCGEPMKWDASTEADADGYLAATLKAPGRGVRVSTSARLTPHQIQRIRDIIARRPSEPSAQTLASFWATGTGLVTRLLDEIEALRQDQVDQVRDMAAYVLDRADQYVDGSGCWVALADTSHNIAMGEVASAKKNGDLDPSLYERVDGFEGKKPKKVIPTMGVSDDFPEADEDEG